jgi:opacity protein-like surface antigen
MKKSYLSLLFIITLCTSIYPLRLGVEFIASNQPTLGVNLRLTDVFELKPNLGFAFAENVSVFYLGLDGNYYLPEMGELQHYAGGGFGLNAVTDATRFSLNGHYGLRYDVNEIISIFGEGGVQMTFNEFIFSSFMGGVGVTFYFP